MSLRATTKVVGGGDTATVREPSYLVAVHKGPLRFFIACISVVFLQVLNQISNSPGVFGSLNGGLFDEIDSATREHPHGVPFAILLGLAWPCNAQNNAHGS